MPLHLCELLGVLGAKRFAVAACLLEQPGLFGVGVAADLGERGAQRADLRGLGGLRRFLGRRLCGRRGGVGFVLVLLGISGRGEDQRFGCG